jgi:hypothetical protein
MYRNFAPAEFTRLTCRSWLHQFRTAMEIRAEKPDVAVKTLVDTNLDRWNKIVWDIGDDWTLILDAITFLEEQQEEQTKEAIITARKAISRKYRQSLLKNIESLEQWLKELTIPDDIRTYEYKASNDNIIEELKTRITIYNRIFDKEQEFAKTYSVLGGPWKKRSKRGTRKLSSD